MKTFESYKKKTSWNHDIISASKMCSIRKGVPISYFFLYKEYIRTTLSPTDCQQQQPRDKNKKQQERGEKNCINYMERSTH